MFSALAVAVPSLLSAWVPGAAAASTSVLGTVEAEALALASAAGQSFADDTASARARLLMWSNGTASGSITASGPATGLVVRARGDQCQGAPVMQVLLDGVQVGSVAVAATVWTDYALPGAWPAGPHRLQVSFTNDHGAAGCDRNLVLDRVQLTGAAPTTAPSTVQTPAPAPPAPAPPAPAPAPSSAAPTPTAPTPTAPTPAAPTPTAAPAVEASPGQPGGVGPAAQVGAVEAEALALASAAGQSFTDDTASARARLLMWSNGTASGSITASGPATGLVVRARGDQCQGAPVMQVLLDGVQVGSVAVAATVWTDYALPGAWPAGPHRLQVSFTNDHGAAGCDRNLVLDRVQLTGAALTTAPSTGQTPDPTATGVNPFVGARDHGDPASAARRAADARRGWDPEGAAALDRVAQGGAASWYGDWNPASSLAATVSARITTERAAGALPVLVAYNIPHRDCGSYSAGGASTGDAYLRWIAALAAGIGQEKAVVILEPDALPQLDCLSAADRTERAALLSSAVDVLTGLKATTVYLDAGNATWQPAPVMAARLRAAGVDRARGFSLNVSGFVANAPSVAYGNEVSRLVGGDKHFVVDSSRNGLGAGDTWCNPAGRALGVRMTSATGAPLADAFTWIKAPGESDGTCGGGPPAGQFWIDYAIGLGRRAAG